MLQKKEIQFKWSTYEKQEFYCPPETDEQKNKIKKANEIYNLKPSRIGDEISHNCLFKKKKTKKMTTRFPQCQKPPEPKIMKELRGNKTSYNQQEPATCGPSNVGESLLYGYEVKHKIYPITS